MIKTGDTNDSYEESHLADKLKAGSNHFFLFSFLILQKVIITSLVKDDFNINFIFSQVFYQQFFALYHCRIQMQSKLQGLR
jgi:hypothetical protein